jgi:hypothetical protein
VGYGVFDEISAKGNQIRAASDATSKIQKWQKVSE